MLETLQNKTYWNTTWENYFTHYQQDIRHSYYIHAFLNDDEKKVLEMGAGSFRDFANLNALGVDCYAFDYSENSVQKAQDLFPHLRQKISLENAFATTYADKEFDFTFHNGFWGCFNDEQILQLALEQQRITRKRFAFTLHNGHNKNFMAYFEKLLEKDVMYSLRFFTSEDIFSLLEKMDISSQNVIIYPVGKGKKYHEDLLIAEGKHDKMSIHNVITQAKNTHITSSERLLCIVNL